MLPLAKVDRY